MLRRYVVLEALAPNVTDHVGAIYFPEPMREIIHGISAAWRTSRVLAGNEWQALLRPPTASARIPMARSRTRALRATIYTLHLLRRFNGNRWRYTCLYRSVAATLTLRTLGENAVLKLGARRDGEEVGAHAWVEDADGRVLYGDAQNFTALRS